VTRERLTQPQRFTSRNLAATIAGLGGVGKVEVVVVVVEIIVMKDDDLELVVVVQLITCVRPKDHVLCRHVCYNIIIVAYILHSAVQQRHTEGAGHAVCPPLPVPW